MGDKPAPTVVELDTAPLTYEAACGLWGVTQNTIRRWRAEGMPHVLGPAIRWYMARFVKNKLAGRLPDKDRKEKAEADKMEAQVAILRRKYLDRDLALRHVELGIVEARGILELIPRRVAARVPQDIRADVEAAVHEDVSATLRSLEGCKEFASEDVIEIETVPEPEAAVADEPETDKTEETYDEA